MEDGLIDLALALATIGGAAFFIRHRLRARQGHQAAFGELARQLGLRFHATRLGVREGQAPPAEQAELQHGAAGRAGLKLLSALPAASAFEIDGQLHGLSVGIGLRERRPGQPMTCAQVHLPRPLGVGLTVSAASALDRAVDALGGAPAGSADVTLGQPDFDRQVRVRATRPEAARRLLADGAVQRAAVALLKDQPAAWADDDAVHVHLAGVVTDPARWRVVFERMATLARALDAAAHGSLR